MTLNEAKDQAKQIVLYSVDAGAPVAMEVAKDSKGRFVVQPFGMHTLFKSHKLLHVEPIPEGARA